MRNDLQQRLFSFVVRVFSFLKTLPNRQSIRLSVINLPNQQHRQVQIMKKPRLHHQSQILFIKMKFH